MNRRDFLHRTTGAALGAALSSALRATGGDRPIRSAITDIAKAAVQDGAAPGIQIAVWHRGVPMATAVAGLANLETGTAVSHSTIFRAGSLTKQFTAALIAGLQEEGRLSVTDPLGEHLPFFDRGEGPSLLELLHHTAGVRDAPDTGRGRRATGEELAREIAAQRPLLDFPVGAAWRYSNANYVLLGAVVEAVTKQSLAKAAQQRIFKPLGLVQTAFDRNTEVVAGRASGYEKSSESGVDYVNAAEIAIEATGGAGAIRTTAEDLCRWHHALLSSDFLSVKTRAAMVAPALLRDGRPATKGRFDPDDAAMGDTAYGYGLMLDRTSRNGELIAMHNGFVDGFSAYLATHVASGVTVACLCNAGPGPALPFRSLRKTVFSAYL